MLDKVKTANKWKKAQSEIEKQMEQISNAKAIELLELGSVMDVINKQAIEDWLLLENTKKSLVYQDVSQALTTWISNGEWSKESVEMLSKQIWNNNSIQYNAPEPALNT